MENLTSARRLKTIKVNDQAVQAQPKETILNAALRAGIDFPNSCRVGGCATCKCKVTKGKVKEMTETGYLLSAEELDQGYVLACQSIAQEDIELEVDLSRATARGIAGRVVAQEKLTHDIIQLRIQLDQPIPYKAGQFANLAIEGLPGVIRSYSFATPSSRDAVVEFHIRKVPGGKLSTLVNDEDIVGRTVHVDGPQGDFYLRSGSAPLMLIAGGSGLAPILGLLKAAAADGVTRPVTLLYGARTQRDLYALDEIAELKERWKAAFEFVPVLSEADADADWSGERGLVTDKIAKYIAPGSHGYLCGPPAMIDGAIATLQQQGVDRGHIHFDRFTTQADSPLVTAEGNAEEANAVESAGIFHYLKYFGFHAIGLLAAGAIFAGGWLATGGLLAVLILYMLGDALLGDDTSTPHFTHPGVLTVQLWLALPLLSLIVFGAIWSVSPGDPLGAGQFIQDTVGWDALAARAENTTGHYFAIFVLTGLMIGMIGTITAHELTHRTWDPVSMLIGRWLLAFSFDTNFAIEHVYGHHRYVSTIKDPATAPRGRNVYFHIVASTIKGNISAFRIEADRLRKKRLPVVSHHNAALRGQFMSLSIVAAAYAMGGLSAMLFFIACGIWGKSLLEIVNYMEHYGMVRNPETPVQPRHSWNTNRRISSWTMFNLTRHSHHHAQGEVPYQDLRPYPDAPMMINGYLTTIMAAMIPPLWHYLMTPKVLEWDREYATAEERELARKANEKSGISTLLEQNTRRPQAGY